MLQTVRKLLSLSFAIFFVLFFAATVPDSLRAQSGYSAQLSGVISDSSGGGVPDAKVTLVDEDTGIARTYATDNLGIYVFTGVRPATYTIRVESANFATQERKGLTLAVSQQASLDFRLSPKTVTEKVVVTEQAPLLDTGNASLGTDVTNEYVRDIPLVNRSFFSLVFLAGGVTETAGQGTEDSYPSGTNFVSNGQRNATAEVRVDGALTSAPEQGEGATTNVYYQPSVEIVQEFKVENNSFSAEYGNNGGTVVNIVLKEGKNKLHGSRWWFGQRSAMEYRFSGRQAARFFCEFCRPRSAPQSGAVAGIQCAYCCPCEPQVQPAVSSFSRKGAADRRPSQRGSPGFRIAGF